MFSESGALSAWFSRFPRSRRKRKIGILRRLCQLQKSEKWTDVDRLAVRHFLFALFSRSRWSDLRHVKRLIRDADSVWRGDVEVLTR